MFISFTQILFMVWGIHLRLAIVVIAKSIRTRGQPFCLKEKLYIVQFELQAISQDQAMLVSL